MVVLILSDYVDGAILYASDRKIECLFCMRKLFAMVICINRQGLRGARANLGMLDYLWGYKGKKKAPIGCKPGVTTRLHSFAPKVGLAEAE
jgi:hypothetical protein